MIMWFYKWVQFIQIKENVLSFEGPIVQFLKDEPTQEWFKFTPQQYNYTLKIF